MDMSRETATTYYGVTYDVGLDEQALIALNAFLQAVTEHTKPSDDLARAATMIHSTIKRTAGIRAAALRSRSVW